MNLTQASQTMILPEAVMHDDIRVCPCPYDSTQEAVAAAKSRLRALEPEQAVKEAYYEDPTSDFINQLGMSVTKDVKYRRSGLATMFIRHIVNGRSNPERLRRHWEWPAHGLSLTLMAVSGEEPHPEDAKILAEILSSYMSVIDVIFKDISFLRQEGEIGDTRRRSVSGMLRRFMGHEKHKRTMYDEKTVKLALTCWLYSSPDDAWTRGFTTPLVNFMFAEEDIYGNSPPPNFLEIAYRSFNTNTFTSQINRCLKSKVLAGEPLALETTAIIRFLSHEAYHKHIVDARIHVLLMKSMRRQLIRSAKGLLPVKEGTIFGTELVPHIPPKTTDKGMLLPENDPNITGLLEESGSFLMTLLTKSPDKNNLLIDIIQNTATMEVGAAAIRLFNRLDCCCSSRSIWVSIFSLIGHIVYCSHPDYCTKWINVRGYRSSPELVHAIKMSLEHIAMPMLFSLTSEEAPAHAGCSTGKRQGFFIKVWTDLIKILGITQESIRERYRAEKKCCNVNCPSRKLEIRLIRMDKKSSCASCHSVFYCSRECQRIDWKLYHKDECKKAKDSQINMDAVRTHFLLSAVSSASDL